jgi:aminoglycoside phosphotransferase (APT) family kinase protein
VLQFLVTEYHDFCGQKQMNEDPEVSGVRAGEEIDAKRLGAYLRLEFGDDDISIAQFPGGSSNLTYLLRLGTAEYVLRRPPFGNTVKTAHDMRREFNVLSKLSTVYKPAPRPLLLCDDETIIGSEFYLMERRHGTIIRGVGPQAASLRLDEGRRSICRSFVQNLADLHAVDYHAAGLSGLGNPEGYNRRQVEGWTKRYIAAKTDDYAEIEQVMAWLKENIPAESGASLVHNDYKFDNVMLDPDDLTRITAVLDWEMVTVGDPLMDLGTTLGYWMSPDAGDEMMNLPFNPRVLMENITRRDLVGMYAAASGREVSNIGFYYTFGTFKIAVIAQQIYARFVKGLTRDRRFAGFNNFVAALGRIAATATEKGDLKVE